MSIELSWNGLKDYLEDQGFSDLRSPRDTIKQAYESELIVEGHSWLEAIKDRNLTSHTYDDKLADFVIDKIRANYFPILSQLYVKLKPLSSCMD